MDLFEFIIEGLKYVKKIEEDGGLECKKGKIGKEKTNIFYNYSIRTGQLEKKVDNNDKKLLPEPVIQVTKEDIDLFNYMNNSLITINNGKLESFHPVIESGVIYLKGNYQKIELPGILLAEGSRIQSWQYKNGIMTIKIM